MATADARTAEQLEAEYIRKVIKFPNSLALTSIHSKTLRLANREVFQFDDLAIPANERTPSILACYRGKSPDIIRKGLHNWIPTHFAWIKKVSEYIMRRKGLNLHDYLQGLVLRNFKWDELALLIYARAYHVHIAVIMKRRFWTTRADGKFLLCEIILGFFEDYYFHDTVALDVAALNFTPMNDVLQSLDMPDFTTLDDVLELSSSMGSPPPINVSKAQKKKRKPRKKKVKDQEVQMKTKRKKSVVSSKYILRSRCQKDKKSVGRSTATSRRAGYSLVDKLRTRRVRKVLPCGLPMQMDHTAVSKTVMVGKEVILSGELNPMYTALKVKADSTKVNSDSSESKELRIIGEIVEIQVGTEEAKNSPELMQGIKSSTESHDDMSHHNSDQSDGEDMPSTKGDESDHAGEKSDEESKGVDVQKEEAGASSDHESVQSDVKEIINEEAKNEAGASSDHESVQSDVKEIIDEEPKIEAEKGKISELNNDDSDTEHEINPIDVDSEIGAKSSDEDSQPGDEKSENNASISDHDSVKADEKEINEETGDLDADKADKSNVNESSDKEPENNEKAGSSEHAAESSEDEGDLDEGKENPHGKEATQSRKRKEIVLKNKVYAISFTCPICDEEFDTKKSGHAHIKKKHHGFMFECPHCGKQYSTPNGLQKHSRKHAERTQVCKYKGCGKKFLFPKDLKEHKRVHTHRGLWKCGADGCDRVYTSKRAWKRHEEAHGKEGDFQCDDCDFASDCKENLRQHVKGAHGEGTAAPCGEYFQWPLYMYEHRAKCDDCKILMANEEKNASKLAKKIKKELKM